MRSPRVNMSRKKEKMVKGRAFRVTTLREMDDELLINEDWKGAGRQVGGRSEESRVTKAKEGKINKKEC